MLLATGLQQAYAFRPAPSVRQTLLASFGDRPTRSFPAPVLSACQIAFSSFPLLRFQIPTGKNAGQPIPFVLKNQSQSSATIRSAIQNINIIKPPLITTKVVSVEETFLGLI